MAGAAGDSELELGLPAGEGVGDGEQVLAVFESAAARDVLAAARSVVSPDGQRLVFEPRDWAAPRGVRAEGVRRPRPRRAKAERRARARRDEQVDDLALAGARAERRSSRGRLAERSSATGEFAERPSGSGQADDSTERRRGTRAHRRRRSRHPRGRLGDARSRRARRRPGGSAEEASISSVPRRSIFWSSIGTSRR